MTLAETLACTGDYCADLSPTVKQVFYSAESGPKYFQLSDWTVWSAGSGPSYILTIRKPLRPNHLQGK